MSQIAHSPNTTGAIVAIVLGAGQGTRMGARQNKVLLRLRGAPILVHALAASSGRHRWMRRCWSPIPMRSRRAAC